MSEPVMLIDRGDAFTIRWVKQSYTIMQDGSKWWHSCDICTARGTPLVWFDVGPGEGVRIMWWDVGSGEGVRIILCSLCLRDILGDVEVLEGR